MGHWKHLMILGVAAAVGLLCGGAGLAQQDSEPPAKKDRREVERGPAPRADAPSHPEEWAPRPREEDADGPPGPPPGKPPRDGRRMPPPGVAGPAGPGQRPPFGPPFWPPEDWSAMEKRDPEMFKLLKEDMDLDRQTRQQAMQYRRAPKEERTKIKERIEQLVNKHFDVRQQRRSLELKRLDEELKRLRDAMERREKGRKDLIEKRVQELLGPDDSGF